MSYGVLLNGNHLIFKGLVNINFTHFFGVKHDSESGMFTFGRFNQQLEVEGIALKNDGINEYYGNFKNGVLEGLGIWLKSGERKGIGLWKKGVRHGINFFFDTVGIGSGSAK